MNSVGDVKLYHCLIPSLGQDINGIKKYHLSTLHDLTNPDFGAGVCSKHQVEAQEGGFDEDRYRAGFMQRGNVELDFFII